MTAQLTDNLAAFVTAGRATFTLVGRETRYTYRVSAPREDHGNAHTRFVSLLTAPDQYTYVGMLSEDGIRLTRKSTYLHTSLPVRAFDWFWRRARVAAPTPGLEFWHAGRCARCGRELTDPESIARGFGPHCWEAK